MDGNSIEKLDPEVAYPNNSTSTSPQKITLLPPEAPRHRRGAMRSIPHTTDKPHDPGLHLAKEELLSLVSGPVAATAAELYEAHRDPFRGGFAAPDGPHIRISDARQDIHFPTQEDMHRISASTQVTVEKLCTSLRRRLRYRDLVPLEKIYATYLELPEPRMLNLTAGWRKELLRVMGMPNKRDSTSMLRYFSLVADVKNAGLTLNQRQWNYALAFAAKYTARVETRQLESAMRLWSEMEREGNQPANEVTFNILFDAATKAGSFALADMLYKEMESRGIPFNHFHHVTLIYYFGLQRDSDGVRAAYKEMVEAGQLVDTIALNCVISGLLRSGEEGAAEDTYRRMRAGGSSAAQPPEKTYMVSKAITKALMMLSKVAKEHPSLKSNFQRSVCISPDLRTFKLFIEHYAVRVGDLGKVVYFLDEMKAQGVILHPTLFLGIFRGFFLHGGHPGSEWSEQRLDSVVNAFYQAQDEMGEHFRIDKWVVIWLLKAIKRCCSQQKLEKAFDEVSVRWDVPMDRRLEVLAICDKIVGRTDDIAAWRIFESTAKLKQMMGNRIIY
ncbi:pentatricopeptide repeat [Cordyceps militaris]|uniref:Pentatricopeptide repeat n=1 Tax=Cordyceps militaris TaxID=73501 RepID=A0A2H4SDT4_CORMI|nr:pentatricopeptide repeat [Cordyceps militaris]